jgi:hypothetical protein
VSFSMRNHINIFMHLWRKIRCRQSKKNWGLMTIMNYRIKKIIKVKKSSLFNWCGSAFRSIEILCGTTLRSRCPFKSTPRKARFCPTRLTGGATTWPWA